MILDDFHFIRPWWLLALLPVLALALLSATNAKRAGNWAQICDLELLPFILAHNNTMAPRRLWPLFALAALLSVIALAGPTWQRLPVPAFRNEAALVIALDLSASMNAADIKPSRLTRARYKIADLLRLRKDGQTALLVYAGDAFVVTPLTTDTVTIASQLSSLTTDIMPSPGSNSAAALAKAAALLKQAGLQQGQILLISDAVDERAIASAKDLAPAYQISVLAVGTEGGAPVPVAGGGFLKDSAGAIVVPKLDSVTLSALAQAGRGDYLTISADDSDIQQLLRRLNQPHQSAGEQAVTELAQWDDKGPWLLLLVLPLAALGFRRGLLVLLPLILAVPQDSFAWELWRNADQRGASAFAQQQFGQAAEQFQTPEWKAAAQYKAGQYQQAAQTLTGIETALAHYNRGNALAQAGQLQQAISAYERALQLAPDDADAKANKALVEQRLKQQQPPPQDGQNSSKSEQQATQDKQQQQQPTQDKQQQEKQQQQAPAQSNQDQAQDNSQSKPAPKPNPQAKPAEQHEAAQAQADQAKAQQATPEDNAATKPASEQQAAQKSEQTPDESEQADAQWLKRIPDEPAGLLKRKFKYQYSQQRNRASSGPSW